MFDTHAITNGNKSTKIFQLIYKQIQHIFKLHFAIDSVIKILNFRLIKLDVHCPQKELESLNETQMEVDDDTIFTMDDTLKEPKHHIANSLDGCLYLVYKFIWSETHSPDGQLLWDKTKSLYQEIMRV